MGDGRWRNFTVQGIFDPGFIPYWPEEAPVAFVCRATPVCEWNSTENLERGRGTRGYLELGEVIDAALAHLAEMHPDTSCICEDDPLHNLACGVHGDGPS